jgi:hypothetical protein
MNRRLHLRENCDPRGVTPGTIVHGARIAVLAIGVVATHGYLSGGLGSGDAGQIALALGLAVLLAAPHQRGAELLGAVAIWLTTCEFMAASHTGQFALWRWAVALAALALVLVITRVPRLRARARANPWRPLRENERRAPPPAAQIARGVVEIEGRARAVAS